MDSKLLWALGLGGAAVLLYRMRSGSLDDITEQVQAARGMRAPTARKYLRQEAKRIRQQVIPELRQDARDLDTRARGWRSARGRGGGAARGSKVQGWWAQMRQAAEYGEIPVQQTNPYGEDELVAGDPDALLCSVKTIARPAGVLSGKKKARFRQGMTDRDPSEWAANFLAEHPSIYRDCLKKTQQEQEDASRWGEESEEDWSRRQAG